MKDSLEEALDRLRDLISEASGQGVADANTMALATADAHGAPSVRTIYVLDVKPPGPAFFVNGRSGKAQQLAQNPRVSLCFYCPAVQHQVLIDGSVARLDEEAADQLWHKRSREAQLGAWASDSTQRGDDPKLRRKQASDWRASAGFSQVPRPEHWQCWRVHAQHVEIWHAGWERLRSRTSYQVDENGNWHVERENP